MKPIAPVQGVCALQYSADDAGSKDGVPWRDILAFIGTTYNFSAKAELPTTFAGMPNLDFMFQVGEFPIEKKKVAISQLNYMTGGLVITARNTDIAETIAMGVASAIDDNFGLSIVKNVRNAFFLSDIIFEFDSAIESHVALFAKIKALLEREIPRSDPFDVKRLGFGAFERPLLSIGLALDAVANQDFIIERRAGEPHSTNRFFSRAPVKTDDHIRVLSLIEEVLIAAKS